MVRMLKKEVYLFVCERVSRIALWHSSPVPGTPDYAKDLFTSEFPFAAVFPRNALFHSY